MDKNIPLTAVNSSQIAAIGHDPETNTLAIQFKNWKGETTSLYHYANVTPEDFEAFKGAPSLGKHFGAQIKSRADRYPFTKIQNKPVEATAAAAHIGATI